MADKPGINRKLLRDAGIGAVLILLIILFSAVPGLFTGPDSFFSGDQGESGVGSGIDTEVPDSDLIAAERAYIHEVFPVISSWDVSQIKTLLVEDTLRETSEQELNNVMARLGDSLGALQSYSEPQRVASHSLPSARDAKKVPGEESYASYQFDAVYTKGRAHVTLKLMEQGTHFEVLAMNIVIKDGTAA